MVAYNTRVAGLEGGAGGATAVSTTSTGYGTYQFLDPTWKDIVARSGIPGLPANASDATAGQTEAAMGWYTEDNRTSLEGRLGRAPDEYEVYLAHHFGSKGSSRLIDADDDQAMSKLFPQKVMDANPHLVGKTAGQIRAKYAKEFGSAPNLAAKPGTAKMTPAEVQAATDQWWALEHQRRDMGMPPSNVPEGSIVGPDPSLQTPAATPVAAEEGFLGAAGRKDRWQNPPPIVAAETPAPVLQGGGTTWPGGPVVQSQEAPGPVGQAGPPTALPMGPGAASPYQPVGQAGPPTAPPMGPGVLAAQDPQVEDGRRFQFESPGPVLESSGIRGLGDPTKPTQEGVGEELGWWQKTDKWLSSPKGNAMLFGLSRGMLEGKDFGDAAARSMGYIDEGYRNVRAEEQANRRTRVTELNAGKESYQNMGLLVGDDGEARLGRFNRKSGLVEVRQDDGSYTAADPGAVPIGKVGQMGEEGFRDLGVAVEDNLAGLKRIKEYTTTVQGSREGLAGRWDKGVAQMKTVFGDMFPDSDFGNIKPQEFARLMSDTKFNQIIGAMRIPFLGPGPLTQKDIEFLYNAAAGQPGLLQNRDVFIQTMRDLYASKVKRANRDISDYNLHAARRNSASGA